MSSPTLAADVTGSLALAQYTPPTATKSGKGFRWELENGVKELAPTQTPPREITVVLTGTGNPHVEKKISVTVYGGALMPNTVVVRTGTTLDIENVDEIAHAVTAKGLPGFSEEALGPRRHRSLNMTTAGTWPIVDALAPHARAHLHVLDDLVAASPVDIRGRFSFSDIEAGEYTLRVFHGSAEIASQSLQVSGETMALGTLPLTPKKTPPQ